MRPPAPRRVCGGCGNAMLSEVVASDQGVSWGMTLPRGDTGQCLRTSVVITTGGVTGIECVGNTDAALQHPEPPSMEDVGPAKSLVLRPRHPRKQLFSNFECAEAAPGIV